MTPENRLYRGKDEIQAEPDGGTGLGEGGEE